MKECLLRVCLVFLFVFADLVWAQSLCPSPSTWPLTKVAKTLCPDCTALVLLKDISPPSSRTCAAYCARLQLECAGTWEDQKDTCEADPNDPPRACSTVNSDTPDVLCKCVTPQKSCDEKNLWSGVVNDSCGFCKVRTNTAGQFGTCRAYCAAQGLWCVKAWVPDVIGDGTCDFGKPYSGLSCDTDFRNLENAGNDMICKCTAEAPPTAAPTPAPPTAAPTPAVPWGAPGDPPSPSVDPPSPSPEGGGGGGGGSPTQPDNIDSGPCPVGEFVKEEEGVCADGTFCIEKTEHYYCSCPSKKCGTFIDNFGTSQTKCRCECPTGTFDVFDEGAPTANEGCTCPRGTDKNCKSSGDSKQCSCDSGVSKSEAGVDGGVMVPVIGGAGAFVFLAVAVMCWRRRNSKRDNKYWGVTSV